MADLEARRELRRKRILENAENRLRKITNSNDLVSEPVKHNLSNYDHYEHHYEEPLQHSTVEEHLPFNVEHLEQPAVLKTQQIQPQTNVSYRFLVIFLLGLCVRYLNLVFLKCEELLGFDLSYLHVSKIFVPFLIYKLTELIMWTPNLSNDKLAFFLQFALKLKDLHSEKLKFLIKLSSFAVSIIKDMMLYFFAFIFFDLLLSIVQIESNV